MQINSQQRLRLAGDISTSCRQTEDNIRYQPPSTQLEQ